MPKLTWTIETTAGTVAKDGPTISDANVARFVDWLYEFHPPLDAAGNPLNRTVAREAQAFRNWADEQWLQTKKTVLQWERQAAAEAAAEAVEDVA